MCGSLFSTSFPCQQMPIIPQMFAATLPYSSMCLQSRISLYPLTPSVNAKTGVDLGKSPASRKGSGVKDLATFLHYMLQDFELWQLQVNPIMDNDKKTMKEPIGSWLPWATESANSGTTHYNLFKMMASSLFLGHFYLDVLRFVNRIIIAYSLNLIFSSLSGYS